MSRTPFVTWLVVLLLLGAGALRAEEERPSPEGVAAWVREGDGAAAQRAVDALDGAPRPYLEAVVRALRGEAVLQPVPAPVPEGATAVTLDVRLLVAGEEALARALGDRVPDAAEPLVLLGAEDVVRLLGPGRRGTPGVRVLLAPRITTYDGQRANVTLQSQTSYVRDYEVHRSTDGRVALDPVVDTLQDGLVFDATPTIDASRARIRPATRTTWAWLKRPIPTISTRIEGREVEVQTPELSVSRVARDFEIAAGGYALLGGLGEAGEGRRALVLLHVVVTTLEDAVPPR